MRELSNLAKWGYHSKITEISLIFWLWALFLLSVVFEMLFWDLQQPLLQVLMWTSLVQTKQDTLLTLPLPNSNKIPNPSLAAFRPRYRTTSRHRKRFPGAQEEQGGEEAAEDGRRWGWPLGKHLFQRLVCSRHEASPWMMGSSAPLPRFAVNYLNFKAPQIKKRDKNKPFTFAFILTDYRETKRPDHTYTTLSHTDDSFSLTCKEEKNILLII